MAHNEPQPGTLEWFSAQSAFYDHETLPKINQLLEMLNQLLEMSNTVSTEVTLDLERMGNLATLTKQHDKICKEWGEFSEPYAPDDHDAKVPSVRSSEIASTPEMAASDQAYEAPGGGSSATVSQVIQMWQALRARIIDFRSDLQRVQDVRRRRHAQLISLNTTFWKENTALLPNPKRGIRLLEMDTVDSLESPEPIRCRLGTRTLHPPEEEVLQAEHVLPDQSDKVGFDALSYAWGDPTLTAEITIDGKPFGVAHNLFQALSVLRYSLNAKVSEKMRPLWIDAICINQCDNEERGIQVTLMKDIYSSAQVVQIWLGPSHPSWLPFMSMARAEMQNSESHLAIEESYFNACMRMVLRDFWNLDDAASEAVAYLCTRPWFTRLWVQQEVLLARQTSWHIGELTISFDSLALVSQMAALNITYRAESSGLRSHTFDSLRSSLGFFEHFSHYVGLRDKFVDVLLAVEAISEINHRCQVGNPHDRIYGLLGLLPPALGVLPDYDAPVECVYTEASFRIMEYFQSLDMLLLHDRKMSESRAGPSWMPELRRCKSVVKRRKLKYMPYDDISYYVNRRDNNILNVKAFVVAQIAAWTSEKGAEIRWESVSMDGKGPTNAGFTACAASLVPLFETWVRGAPLPEGVAPTKSIFISLKPGGRLLITEHGHYATVENDFQPSTTDVVAILAGCSMPFIIRPLPDHPNAYTLLGACFQDGIMYGEAVRKAALERFGSEDRVEDVFEEIDLH